LVFNRRNSVWQVTNKTDYIKSSFVTHKAKLVLSIKFGIPDWPSVEQAPRVGAFLSAAQNLQAAKKVQNIAKNDCKKP
jgi:hypothetical protein